MTDDVETCKLKYTSLGYLTSECSSEMIHWVNLENESFCGVERSGIVRVLLPAVVVQARQRRCDAHSIHHQTFHHGQV